MISVGIAQTAALKMGIPASCCCSRQHGGAYYPISTPRWIQMVVGNRLNRTDSQSGTVLFLLQGKENH